MVRLTPADLRQVAASAAIKVVAGDDVVSAAAGQLSEAISYYVLRRRMDRANAGPSDVEKWAGTLQRWTAEGLVLIGGTVEQNEISREFPTPHCRAAMHLADACPFEDPKKTELLLRLARDGTERCDLVQLTATALQLLRYLAPMLAERSRRLRRKGRPAEEARQHLFRQLAVLFGHMHAVPFTPGRRHGHAQHDGERDNRPAGLALAWVQALFKLAAVGAAVRGLDDIATDLADLAEWATRRPDAVAELMAPRQKKSGK